MLRDKRKDIIYFEKYIDYQKERISKKTEKISSVIDEGARSRINLSLIKYKIDLLIAEFSSGCGIEILRDDLASAIKTANEMNRVDYESLLILLSVSVMTDELTNGKELIEKHGSEINTDRLLNVLAMYICDNKVEWKKELQLGEIYSELELLENADNKAQILLDYLDNWYEKHKDFSWFDADKGIYDTYVGYWSFECAALAKMYKINEELLANNPFYPSI